MAEVPLPQTDLFYGLCHRYAERGEAVEHSNADLELGDLTRLC
jgi:hypothetical protein